MLICHHLHLIERRDDTKAKAKSASFYCTDCRSIVGTWDLPASHRRTIQYLPCSPGEHLIESGAAS